MHSRTAQETARRLFTRKCVACGYDGEILASATDGECPRCGCDLHDRPPRSYAEMEGLMERMDMVHTIHQAAGHVRQTTYSVLLERWLWFGFLSLLLIFAIAALAVSAVGHG